MPANYSRNSEHATHETVVTFVDEKSISYYCFDCDKVVQVDLNQVRSVLGLGNTTLDQHDRQVEARNEQVSTSESNV